MKRLLILHLLALLVLPSQVFLLPSQVFANSQNEHLSCVKEVPNPMSLAARRDYVLTCITKTPGLTVTAAKANQGQCTCRALRSMTALEPKTRIMFVCQDAGKPCDFTEVSFETSEGSFAFTWAPDADDLELN